VNTASGVFHQYAQMTELLGQLFIGNQEIAKIGYNVASGVGTYYVVTLAAKA